MPNKKIPGEIHFSDDICVVLADFSAACLPEYQDLMERYPYADGMRDISICTSCIPTDAGHLAQSVKEGRYTWVGIGWLIYSMLFVTAAQEAGMSARRYADEIYRICDEINSNAGYRAAWIEAYGEIGNSITWPAGKTFTKKEALKYFRDWFTCGKSHTEHWERVTKPDLINFYTDARSRSSDLRSLPIYYTDGTLLALHEAFRMGFPLVVYEGQADSMNPIQAGVAFVRGGAKMFDALWGCDFAPWVGEPLGEWVGINKNGLWTQGMTADYMFRAWLSAYMAGCNTLLHEVGYTFFYAEPRDGLIVPTEYGFNAMRFYGLKEGTLANRGRPVVPIAIMLEEEHGYRGDILREYSPSGELKSSNCGQNPESRVDIWHNRIPHIGKGDWQVHRLISHIWPLPGNKWAEAAGKWPDEAVKAFPENLRQDFRKGKEDPREYSRFLSDSRWADCFDVVDETSSIHVLMSHYKAIVLAGEIKTDNGLWEKLKQFVEGGGTVLASADQLHDDLLAFLGVAGMPVEMEIDPVFENGFRSSSGREKAYNAHVFSCNKLPETTMIVRDRISGKPLAFEIGMGDGRLAVMLVSYGLKGGTASISNVFDYLLQGIYNEYVGVQLEGPSCQMLVNETQNETIITLINHTGRLWDGSVAVKRKNRPSISSVWDMLSGEDLPDGDVAFDDCAVLAKVYVKAYDIKVIAFGKKAYDYVKTWPTVASSLTGERAEKLRQTIMNGPEYYLLES